MHQGFIECKSRDDLTNEDSPRNQNCPAERVEFLKRYSAELHSDSYENEVEAESIAHSLPVCHSNVLRRSVSCYEEENSIDPVP